MKTKILTLIILALGTFSFAQSLDDESGYLIINEEKDTFSIQKDDVLRIQNNGSYVLLVQTSVTNSSNTGGYLKFDPDDYSQFANSDTLFGWINKAVYEKYDSIVYIYDGSIVDTSKFYIGAELQYFIDYDNDGTNITTTKY